MGKVSAGRREATASAGRHHTHGALLWGLASRHDARSGVRITHEEIHEPTGVARVSSRGWGGVTRYMQPDNDTRATVPPAGHRWYTRPVFFVADIHRATRFYVDLLGFEVGWHEADGAGTVCQVNHGECEIILCQDHHRKDRARLFIELTTEGLAALRSHLVARGVATKETRWGYDTLQVDDPDGNELLFPRPD